MTVNKLVSGIALLVIAGLAAGCGAVAGGGGNAVPTPDDPQAAGAFLPTVSGYSVTSANSISAAISAAAGEGADQFGNAAVQVAVDRIDAFIRCYQEVGAVAANIYTQIDLADALGGNVTPSMGAVAVVNQDRVRENLISCVTSGGNDEGFSAQSAPSLCQASGNFSTGGDTFTYIYISTDDAFCTAVDNHFAGIN